MVLLVATVFDSKPKIIKAIKEYLKTQEDDYVEMDQGCGKNQQDENVNHSIV